MHFICPQPASQPRENLSIDHQQQREGRRSSTSTETLPNLRVSPTSPRAFPPQTRAPLPRGACEPRRHPITPSPTSLPFPGEEEEIPPPCRSIPHDSGRTPRHLVCNPGTPGCLALAAAEPPLDPRPPPPPHRSRLFPRSRQRDVLVRPRVVLVLPSQALYRALRCACPNRGGRRREGFASVAVR